ncbi:MAG: L-ribulose-5-phosphate 4-epimerase AraD [Spirochaetales bacterium]|nr:L-ribulose-5-phosphate 4-epimerase AraD [Spirochaetales bacterium]
MERLREEVYQANMELRDCGLVTATFGNVSGIDRSNQVVAIKPSGVPYGELSPQKMVLVDLEYNVLGGELNPSSDTRTHVMLYRAFKEIGAVVHTHSTCATAWAQAMKPLPCFGTTHADIFYGEVPCTAVMRDDQISRDYEEETAVQILETFKHYDYNQIPGVLVACHGPFAWGQTPHKAVYHSLMLETIAETAILSLNIDPGLKAIKRSLLDKHFLRKHGANAYYGQTGKE